MKKKIIRAIDSPKNIVWRMHPNKADEPYYDLDNPGFTFEMNQDLNRYRIKYKSGDYTQEEHIRWSKQDILVLLDPVEAKLAKYFRICDEIKENYEKTGMVYVKKDDSYYFFVKKVTTGDYSRTGDQIIYYANKLGIGHLFTYAPKEQKAEKALTDLLAYCHALGRRPKQSSKDKLESSNALKLTRIIQAYNARLSNSREKSLMTKNMLRVLQKDKLIQKWIYESSDQFKTDECHRYFRYVEKFGRPSFDNPKTQAEKKWGSWLQVRRQAKKGGSGTWVHLKEYDEIAKSYGFSKEFNVVTNDDREKKATKRAKKICTKYRTLAQYLNRCTTKGSNSSDAYWVSGIGGGKATGNGKGCRIRYKSVEKILDAHFEVKNFLGKSKKELKIIYEKRGY